MKRNDFAIVSALIVVGWCASELRARSRLLLSSRLLRQRRRKPRRMMEPCVQPAPMVRLEDITVH